MEPAVRRARSIATRAADSARWVKSVAQMIFMARFSRNGSSCNRHSKPEPPAWRSGFAHCLRLSARTRGKAKVLRAICPVPHSGSCLRAPDEARILRRPGLKLMGLTFFESIKQYVGFTDESSAALRAFHPSGEPFSDVIIADSSAAIEALYT